MPRNRDGAFPPSYDDTKNSFAPDYFAAAATFLACVGSPFRCEMKKDQGKRWFFRPVDFFSWEPTDSTFQTDAETAWRYRRRSPAILLPRLASICRAIIGVKPGRQSLHLRKFQRLVKSEQRSLSGWRTTRRRAILP